MISTMGDAEGNGKGDFLLIDAEEGAVKGKLSVNKMSVIYFSSKVCQMFIFNVCIIDYRLFIYFNCRNMDKRQYSKIWI
jgi:hypothetical protein